MHRSVPFIALFALGGTPLLGQEPADIVLRNAKVYTANDQQPRAQAVAIKGNRIVFVGSDGDARKHTGPATKVMDLKGAAVYPGFTDAHMHLSGVGGREMSLNLEGTKTLEELLARVKTRVDLARPGQWVTGRGWIETCWKPPVFWSGRATSRAGAGATRRCS